jgi:putative ABC transport system permease protein
LPLRDGASQFTFRLAGAASGDRQTADARYVSADYFRALRIPVLRGTTPVIDAPITFGAAADRFEGQRPIAVSASAGERFWPGEDAIGKVIDGGWFEAIVVGVVGDVRQVGLAESPGPTLYFADGPQINATVVVRTAGDPGLLAGPIRAAIREIDPNQSIRSVVALRDVMADSVASDRFFTLLYVAFGALGLTLAAVGVYGVVSYSVGMRTREIGVLVAVGADPAAILKGVVERGMRPVFAGVALGSPAALLLARVIEHQLYGIGANDPSSFFVAPAVLLSVAALACYVPARAAARIDPVIALRSE